MQSKVARYKHLRGGAFISSILMSFLLIPKSVGVVVIDVVPTRWVNIHGSDLKYN